MEYSDFCIRKLSALLISCLSLVCLYLLGSFVFDFDTTWWFMGRRPGNNAGRIILLVVSSIILFFLIANLRCYFSQSYCKRLPSLKIGAFYFWRKLAWKIFLWSSLK